MKVLHVVQVHEGQLHQQDRTTNQHTKSVRHHWLCQMAWRHYCCTKQTSFSPLNSDELNISYCFHLEESDGSPRVPLHVWGGCVEQIRSEFSCSNQNPAAQHSNVIWTAGLCTTTLSDIRATAVPILLLMWAADPLFHFSVVLLHLKMKWIKVLFQGHWLIGVVTAER